MTRTTSKILSLAALLLASSLLAAGCMGGGEELPPQPPTPALMTFEDPPPTPTPEPEDKEPAEEVPPAEEPPTQEMENLLERLAALEARTDEIAATATEAVQAAARLEPTPIAPPDLCGRDEEVQLAILEELGKRHCQSVTDVELENITELTVTIGPRLCPDDFAGLTSLTTLHLIGTQEFRISPGEFRELPTLRTLAITSDAQGIIEEDAFLGLRNLESMTIGINDSETHPEDSFHLPILRGTPELKSFYIYTHNQIPDLREGQFDHLPNLETVYIEGEIPHERDDRTWRLPEDIFLHNTRLVNVDMQVGGYKSSIRASTGAFLHLEELNHLNMGHSFEAKSDLRLWLSPESPLLEKILDDEQAPLGYTLLLPGTE